MNDFSGPSANTLAASLLLEELPTIEYVRYLGLTPTGLVQIEIGLDDGDPRRYELPADAFVSGDTLAREVGAQWSYDAETTLRDGVLPEIPSRLFRTFNAQTLETHDFPAVTEIIPGILPEGLAVLAGKPKVGKSWWTMAKAAEVARTGSVLYLALEDPPRRLQARMAKVLRGATAPRSLTFHTEWPRLDSGGLLKIGEWLEGHSGAKLVIIDTLAKIRPARGANEDQYLGDYGVWGALQSLTLLHPGIAIVCVHHQRKGADEDILSTVLGSQGVTGVADTILVLSKARGQADGELFVTGRDIPETERALRFDDGVWSDVGAAADFRVSEERDEVAQLLAIEGPMKIAEVARTLGLKYHTARQRLVRAADAGRIERDGDEYKIP